MKNQYFGDINDYRKYGLLRSILSASDLSVLVAWMLTPDDNSADGKHISYLQHPSKWSTYDQDLYHCLHSLLNSNQKRQVGLIENAGILSRTAYFSDIVSDNPEPRNIWFKSLMNHACDSDLIFLDPDNGLEVKSKPYGCKSSSKFLFWHEVEELWKLKKSLLIYQHFIRENRQVYIGRLLNVLKHIAPDGQLEAYVTPHVVFFLLLQPSHVIFHNEIADSVSTRWRDQVQLWKA